MCQFAFFVFFISICIFAGIMLHDPRTLWSGASFLIMVACLSVFLLLVLYQYSEWLAAYDLVIGILVVMFVLAVGGVVVFPVSLILVFFVEGIRVIRHEGIKPTNLLSMLFSVLLCIYLVVCPAIGNLGQNTLGTMLYTIISCIAVYVLSLLAVYSLSAVFNLFHLKKKRDADYIIVLGAGIIGSRVTPLLAARIEKGIELLCYNPNAVLIMSGGQGSGEDIPESKAMADYALEKGVGVEKIILEQKSVSTQENLCFSRELMNKQKPQIIIVTTAYHVFRALILAKQQGIRCVGFGAKTKWYFTLNAFIREFVGYFKLTWKKHIIVIGITVCIVIAWYGLK
ncbi:MAG: YdcF family protein [Lachnospiraceae bacterium]|nr:YdcF family protein [Lachnospiraceae bacterium]